MSEQVKVAVVGCGYWGPNLVRNFHPSGVIHLVAIRLQQLVTLWASEIAVIGAALRLGRVQEIEQVLVTRIRTPAQLSGLMLTSADPLQQLVELEALNI